MARTNTSKLKLPKHDTGDLNWGADANEALDVLDAHAARATLRPPRTLSASLGSGAVGAHLAALTTYFYKVTAVNDLGETTEGLIPATVEAQVTQPATPVPVMLQWEAAEGATGYKVYKSTASGAEKLLAAVSGGSTVVYTDSGNTATQDVNVPSSNMATRTVTGLKKEAESTILSGDVTLKAGANVTLTQDNGDRSISIASTGGGETLDASDTVKGISKLSVAPAEPANPIAVGDNDSRMTNARTPTSHALAGDEHSSATLAQLNDKISDADLDAAGTARPPTAHALGGAEHSQDTVANLNAKLSDGPLAKEADAVLKSLFTTKGDIVSRNADSQVARLPLGPSGYYLKSDSAQPFGMNWSPIDTGLVTQVVAAPSGDANTDTANIQAALTAIGSDGGIVQLRAGTYIVNASLTYKNKTWIRGQGANATAISVPASSNFIVFKPSSSQAVADMCFSDIYFNMANNNGAAARVITDYLAASVNRFRVERCRFYGSSLCAFILLANGTVCADVQIIDNFCQPGAQDSQFPIDISGYYNRVLVTGNTVIGYSTSYYAGIRINPIGDKAQGLKATVAFNTILGETGSPTLSLLTVTGTDCVVIGNLVEPGAIWCYLDKSTVLGNKVDQITLGSGCANNVVAGNKGTLVDSSAQTNNEKGIVAQSLADAKGDLIAATAADAFTRLAVGTDGQVLTADAASAAGIKWAAAAGGSYATQVVAAPTGVAATDTANVQNAINALPTNGGTVVLREGTYVLNTVTPKANMWIVGQGRGTILQLNADPVFNAAGLANLRFSDMKVVISGGGSFIKSSSGNPSNHTLERIWFDLSTTGGGELNPVMYNGSMRYDIRVIDCYFDVSSDATSNVYCIRLTGGTNTDGVIISGCVFDFTHASAVSGGCIQAATLYNGTIEGNKLIGNNAAYFLQAGLDSMVVRGNIIIKNGDPGTNPNLGNAIWTLGSIADSVIADNTIEVTSASGAYAFGIRQTGGTVQRSSFTGNTIKVGGSAVGMSFGESSSTFTQNAVTGNVSPSITIAANAGSTGNVIVGNRAVVTDSSGGTNTVASNG